MYYLRIFLLIFLCYCKCEEYDNIQDYDGNGSIEDSKSNEVLNFTFKQKPERVRVYFNNTHTQLVSYRDNSSNDGSLLSPLAKQSCNQQGIEEDRFKGTIANYPYAVSLQKMGSHYASAALVAKKWVLSTANEFFNVRESIKLYRARIGSVDCKKGGTVIPLKRVEIHPSYVPGRSGYDLSLIQLAQPVEYSDFIRPISLSNIRDKVISARFLTTYWPRLIINGRILPSAAKERIKQTNMRVSLQKMMAWEKCYRSMHLRKEILAESSLCLKPIQTHHSICMPDVGAPVVADDGLWGITSGWTAWGCKTNPHPTIFTRVSLLPVRSWFDALMLEDSID